MLSSTITVPIEEGYITVAMVKALMTYAADPTPSKSINVLEKNMNCLLLFIIVLNLHKTYNHNFTVPITQLLYTAKYSTKYIYFIIMNFIFGDSVNFEWYRISMIQCDTATDMLYVYH